MDLQSLLDYALTFPDVEESFPFGPDTLVLKVNGKAFVLIPLDEQPLRFNVKCDPDKALELRDQYPLNVLPGYHMNKKHWNTIVADNHLKWAFIKEMVSDSYHLVSVKKKK